MPIKKLTVSFDLPIATFLSMLAAGNAGMKIDVFGDDKPRFDRNGYQRELMRKRRQDELNGHPPKLLEAPNRKGFGKGVRGQDANGNPVNGRTMILKHFAEHKGSKIRARDLEPLLQAVGLAKGCSGMLFAFKEQRLIKNVGLGHYTITAKGLSEVAKREASNG